MVGRHAFAEENNYSFFELLPAELLWLIGCMLTFPEVHQLKQTCKKFYETFSGQFFKPDYFEKSLNSMLMVADGWCIKNNNERVLRQHPGHIKSTVSESTSMRILTYLAQGGGLFFGYAPHMVSTSSLQREIRRAKYQADFNFFSVSLHIVNNHSLDSAARQFALYMLCSYAFNKDTEKKEHPYYWVEEIKSLLDGKGKMLAYVMQDQYSAELEVLENEFLMEVEKSYELYYKEKDYDFYPCEGDTILFWQNRFKANQILNRLLEPEIIPSLCTLS